MKLGVSKLCELDRSYVCYTFVGLWPNVIDLKKKLGIMSVFIRFQCNCKKSQNAKPIFQQQKCRVHKFNELIAIYI